MYIFVLVLLISVLLLNKVFSHRIINTMWFQGQKYDLIVWFKCANRGGEGGRTIVVRDRIRVNEIET